MDGCPETGDQNSVDGVGDVLKFFGLFVKPPISGVHQKLVFETLRFHGSTVSTVFINVKGCIYTVKGTAQLC